MEGAVLVVSTDEVKFGSAIKLGNERDRLITHDTSQRTTNE